MHGKVDGVGAEEGDPEVQFTQALIHHSPGYFRVPMVDSAEHHQDRRDAHDHVEVGDDEIGVR